MAKEKEVKEKSLSREVELYQTLSKVDVSQGVELKATPDGKYLRVLPWAWAYNYVASRYSIVVEHGEFDAEGREVPAGEHGLPYRALDGGTRGYIVKTTVTIDGITKSMTLPVMDARNNPVRNVAYEYMTPVGKVRVPAFDSMLLNTAQMRCLVKTISLFGLGMYLYAGEDLPFDAEEMPVAQPEKKPEDQQKEAKAPEEQTGKKPSKKEPAEPAQAKAEPAPKQKAQPEKKAEPKAKPEPVPEPEPDPDDEIIVEDALSGEVLEEVAKEISAAPKEPEPESVDPDKKADTEEEARAIAATLKFSLEEALQHSMLCSPRRLKGTDKTVQATLDTYRDAKAVSDLSKLLNFILKKTRVPSDIAAVARVVTAFERNELTIPGYTAKSSENGIEFIPSQE